MLDLEHDANVRWEV
jgi:hypothetical protein